MRDVRVALRVCTCRIGVDELTVVADPYRPLLRDVRIAVPGVAHQLGLVELVHHVDAGAGDQVGVAGVLPAPVGGRVGGDRGAVLLDDEFVRVHIRNDDLVAADGEVAGDVGGTVGRVVELQPVQLGVHVHGRAGGPVVL